MAQLVLGVGTSHSPMVSMDGPDWLSWGERDHAQQMLYTRDGRNITYEEALALSTPELAARAEPDACVDGAVSVAAAVERLRAAVADANLDALIVIGDDQSEHLLGKNLPPFMIYWGDTITNGTVPPNLDEMAPMMQHFLPSYYEVDGEQSYPVEVALARHLITTAFDEGFDVATSNELPEERGMGHAFGFPMRFIAQRIDLPVVPVMVNTYHPPAQPRSARCLAFGEMVRRAVDSYPGDARIGVLASGGLSHFMVLEDLDREVLAHLAGHNLDALCAIPEATLQSGTSEIKNWIAAAGALNDFNFELVDYVPGYRTPAGSGTGLAFALWSR